MNEGGSFVSEAAKQSLVKFGPFALPYLTDNLRSSTSVEGLSESMHAIRLVGTADASRSIASLEAVRARIPQVDSLDDKAKKGLLEECNRAIDDLRQQQGAQVK